MGCGSSTAINQPSITPGDGDRNTVEALLLQLWAERMVSGAIPKIAEQLIAVAPRQMDQVELYLPQFAHIVANLAGDLDVEGVRSLERFLLSVSQLSIHLVSVCARAHAIRVDPPSRSATRRACLPAASPSRDEDGRRESALGERDCAQRHLWPGWVVP